MWRSAPAPPARAGPPRRPTPRSRCRASSPLSPRAPAAAGPALTPDLELRVLRLQHLVPGLGVDPVRDILRVVVGLDLEREGVAPGAPLEHRAPVELRA